MITQSTLQWYSYLSALNIFPEKYEIQILVDVFSIMEYLSENQSRFCKAKVLYG